MCCISLSVIVCVVSLVHSEANARRIAIVESCFGSAGVVSFDYTVLVLHL